ncbi:MAG: type IV toxin-antitoxin system AbiEi family antitoxin domain-containing protein [Pirellulales bacterium]
MQKITKLLAGHRPGTLLLAKWLEKHGISRALQHRYLDSGWLESIGPGAFRRTGDEVTILGAVATLQQQADSQLHPGAITALELLGLAHYVRLAATNVWLFSPARKTLPSWLRNHDWKTDIRHYNTTFLPQHVGLQDHVIGSFQLRISSAERAAMECLYLAPDDMDLVEVREIFTGLSAMRPKLLQLLLEQCKSIKVKRLLLYLGDLTHAPWRQHIDRTRIDLGSGHRQLKPGGHYVSEYDLTIPEELAGS